MERLEQLAKELKARQTTHDPAGRGLTILITGVTSGIGLYAAKLLCIINPLHRIILVARDQTKADFVKEQIVPLLPKQNHEYYAEHIIPLACDHTSLESIRQFNLEVRKRLDETFNSQKWAYNGIDVLCLNAAVLVKKDSSPQFTEDGMEVTFQTNYLAQFLMAQLTHDILTPGGRVVISTSGLFSREPLRLDGAIDGETGMPRKRFEMMDGRPFHYKQSYSQSKLCCVVMCGELARRLKEREIIVNCFSPGFISKSGLFRNQGEFKNAEELVDYKEILAKEKTVDWGAGALVFMALADETGERSGEFWTDADSTLGTNSVYGKQFCPTSIAEMSYKPEIREKLWQLSNQLAGIK